LTPLLPTSYLPTIAYIATCVQSGKVEIEYHEHFIKQTFRNRALIYGANGILPLIIPVQHENLFRIPVHEVKISYHDNWQKIHWRSIVSAYRNSAFFDYFEDEFAPFYQRKFGTLCEFNHELLMLIFRILQVEVEISTTLNYQKFIGERLDLPNAFTTLQHDSESAGTSVNRYRQVFSGKHGFIPGLSIVDLLFNEGPQTMDYLSRISLPG
jgi:hypothetical protein